MKKPAKKKRIQSQESSENKEELGPKEEEKEDPENTAFEVSEPANRKSDGSSDSPRRKTGFPFDKELSTKTFVLSQLGILIIALIFLVGLYWFLNKDFQKPSLNNYEPVTMAPSSFGLEINNPDDEILVYDKSIIVSGKTGPNVTVIITNGDQTEGLETNPQGEFSRVLELNPGLNLITINAFDQNGDNKKEKRTIYYTEEKLQ